MPSLSDHLQQELAAIRQAGLRRTLTQVDSPQGAWITVDGRDLLNFASNDYLGLANHPQLRDAAMAGIERFGVGAGASRLVTGNLQPYTELEDRLAAFKEKEAAVVFGSGYAANVGTITALVGKGDVVVLDKLDHASIVDGARLGPTVRVYPHGDVKKLERILAGAGPGRGGDAAPTGDGLSGPGRGGDAAPTGEAPSPVVGAASPPRPARTLIVTETVFSMDGDLAPLEAIVELKERYGAWLMIDEAHGTGVYGPHRRGLAESLGLETRIDVVLGTLSKAIGCAGGFVCGSQALVDFLRNRARSLIYSTALPPGVCAAAAAAVDLVSSGEGQECQDRLWRNVGLMKDGISALGWDHRSASPIMPLIVGAEDAAVRLSQELREQGIFVPAIRYPTVARGKARLRVTVSAAHTEDDIKVFLDVLRASHSVARSQPHVGAASPPRPDRRSSAQSRSGVGAASPPRPGVKNRACPPTLSRGPTGEEKKRPPHQSALRANRVSLPDECYFITTCVEGRRPLLSAPGPAQAIIDSLRWLRDQQRIRLLGFVVMPDHVHAAFALPARKTGLPTVMLEDVMQDFKGFTSHKLKKMLSLTDRFWQKGYHDRLLRDRAEFEKRLAYMHANPVREDLVGIPEEYLFSTAHPDYEMEIDWEWVEGVVEPVYPRRPGRGGDAAPTDGDG